MCGGDHMMKRCELCKGRARILCESDQARLCWNCDARVHSANFLVARHSRNLLCHVCKSPTPWSAAGAKLKPTFAVCERCVVDGRREDESDEEESAAEVDKEEVVEENQVVPWSPPPAAESSTTDDDSVSGGDTAVSRKRCRVEIASSDLLSDEDLSCSSSRLHICAPPPPPISTASLADALFSPVPKNLRTDSDRTGSRGSDPQQRFHREETDSGEEITEYSTFPKPSI